MALSAPTCIFFLLIWKISLHIKAIDALSQALKLNVSYHFFIYLYMFSFYGDLLKILGNRTYQSCGEYD